MCRWIVSYKQSKHKGIKSRVSPFIDLIKLSIVHWHTYLLVRYMYFSVQVEVISIDLWDPYTIIHEIRNKNSCYHLTGSITTRWEYSYKDFTDFYITQTGRYLLRWNGLLTTSDGVTVFTGLIIEIVCLKISTTFRWSRSS